MHRVSYNVRAQAWLHVTCLIMEGNARQKCEWMIGAMSAFFPSTERFLKASKTFELFQNNWVYSLKCKLKKVKKKLTVNYTVKPKYNRLP